MSYIFAIAKRDNCSQWYSDHVLVLLRTHGHVLLIFPRICVKRSITLILPTWILVCCHLCWQKSIKKQFWEILFIWHVFQPKYFLVVQTPGVCNRLTWKTNLYYSILVYMWLVKTQQPMQLTVMLANCNVDRKETIEFCSVLYAVSDIAKSLPYQIIVMLSDNQMDDAVS